MIPLQTLVTVFLGVTSAVWAIPKLPVVIAPKNPNAPEKVSSAKSVLVIGGGIAGLSAAMELAERGYQVTVRERSTLGGRVDAKAKSIQYAKVCEIKSEVVQRLTPDI
jgi:heterodisulfide reductase subunit A-like polyferredoxin